MNATVVILIAIAVIVVPFLLAAISFLLGFRLGGDHSASELTRLQIVQAERQLHDLTRQAFVAMAEAAERKGSSRQGR